jgi:hypothetical protein
MLVFQYGSNMSSARLNDATRLNGAASFCKLVSTVEPYDLAFTVWSHSNQCAAADIVPNPDGRSIIGVLYEIPDCLIARASAKSKGRKSLDAIEREGVNYRRTTIQLADFEGDRIRATTYVVRERRSGLKTSRDYAQHLVDGMVEHPFPDDYRRYVIRQIELNNPQLEGVFNCVY